MIASNRYLGRLRASIPLRVRKNTHLGLWSVLALLYTAALVVRVDAGVLIEENLQPFVGLPLACSGAALFFGFELAIHGLRKTHRRFRRKANALGILVILAVAAATALNHEKNAMVEEQYSENQGSADQSEKAHYRASLSHRIGHLEQELRDLNCEISNVSRCREIWDHLSAIRSASIDIPNETRASRIARLHKEAGSLDHERVCYCSRIYCKTQSPERQPPNLAFLARRLYHNPSTPASMCVAFEFLIIAALHFVLWLVDSLSRRVRKQAAAGSGPWEQITRMP